jgi:hypothetical protein
LSSGQLPNFFALGFWQVRILIGYEFSDLLVVGLQCDALATLFREAVFNWPLVIVAAIVAFFVVLV